MITATDFLIDRGVDASAIPALREPAGPRLVTDQYERWRKTIERMQDPAFELDYMEFVNLHLQYRSLRSAGVRFDPALETLMLVLERQAMRSEESIEDCDPGLKEARGGT